MKFLDDIAQLKAAAELLQKAKDDLSDLLGDATRQLGEVQQFLADAPTPFAVVINQNGTDITVSEKDGMALFAALVRALEGEKVSVRLASGQTPTLALTDLEQIATKIIGAMA